MNFSCLNSNLDPTGITDDAFWSLSESVARGSIPNAVLQIIVFILATGWNLFIITVYIIKREMLKEPANILLFTLAITDLLVCLIIVPVAISVSVAKEFVLGHNDGTRCMTCSIQGFFFVILTVMSLHFLAMLSIDRCILLSNPFKYPKYRKVKVWILLIILVWILGFIMAIPPAFGFGEWEFNGFCGFCLPRWLPARNFTYMIFLFSEALIPIFIIIFTNTWTYKIVRLFLKKKLIRQNSFRANTKTCHQQQQQTQLVNLFGALVISNLVAWVPVIILLIIVISTNGHGIPDWIFLIAWYFYLINPLVHPVLESLFIKELRSKFSRIKQNIIRFDVHQMTAKKRTTPKNIPTGENKNLAAIPDTSTIT